jgi:hypothetical protein
MRWIWLRGRISLTCQSNTGMIDVRVLGLRLFRRVPVDEPVLRFVRKTNYRLRFIIHADGGNSMQVVCERCGAAYPFRWAMTPTGCGNCSVDRQSGIVIVAGVREWKWVVRV